MGQKKTDKNAHILTDDSAVLPSLSDTTSLSSCPILAESNTHPLTKSSTLCLLSSSMSIYPNPMLQKTNTFLTSFADLNVRTVEQEVIEFSPFIRRKFVLKRTGFETSFRLTVLSKTTKVVHRVRALFRGRH